jgi:predicted RecB family endonuclease
MRACGYDVTEEYPVGGGKTIDLLATKAGRRVAIEVETGASDAEGNVQKCLDAGMNDVLVVATSSRAHETLAQRLRGATGVKVLSANEAIARLAR